jgi:hypothetical protein
MDAGAGWEAFTRLQLLMAQEPSTPHLSTNPPIH